MRVRLRALVLLAVTSAAGLWDVSAGAPDYKNLYDAHRWFELRDAVAADPRAPRLYRGAVAYAFHDLRAAERELRAVVDAAPRSGDAIEARSLLISVAQATGNYAGALQEIQALQGIVDDPRGLANGASLFGALAPFPRQTTAGRRSATVRYTVEGGNLFVPVSANGHSARYIVDTGANFSVMSEGEARRVGLVTRDGAGSHGTDAAGTDVPFRLGLAERLSVGGYELRNVIFLIARDDQQPFVDLPVGARGVLGIPALLAFGSIRWHADGQFVVGEGRALPGPSRRANLCFDGADLQARAEVGGKPITVFLDTGATRTRLMPRFTREFPGSIRGAKEGTTTVRGVGGSTSRRAAIVETVTLRLGGGDLTLRSAEALLDPVEERNDRFHVWAGLDLFAHAAVVSIDFRAMALSAR